MFAFRVAAGATALMALLVVLGVGDIELPSASPAADTDVAVLPVAGTVELAGKAAVEAGARIAGEIDARQTLVAGDADAGQSADGEDPGLARIRDEIETAPLDEAARAAFLARLDDEGGTAMGRAILLAEMRAALLE